MKKTSILALTLVTFFATSAHAGLNSVPKEDSITIQVAKKGADDKQKDDRGGSRLGDDSRVEQIAREGGVRGRGRGV